MHITIAICTRNRPHLLRRCLQSLQPQLTDQDELLVVDSASTTVKTKIVAHEMAAGYIYVHRPGLDVARNTAVNTATSDIIAFIDDDAIAADDWITVIRRAFADESVACVTGRTLPLSMATDAQRHFEFRFSFDRGDQPQRFMQEDNRPWFPVHPYHLGSGCNMAFRRLVFDDIGLFDEALDAGTVTGGGGDLDIFRRLLLGGYQAAYVPDALIYHEHRKEASANRRQFWGYGKTFGALMTKISSEPAFSRQVPHLVRQQFSMLLQLTWKRLLGRHQLPYHLIALEGLGNLIGPIAYFLAVRQMQAQRLLFPFSDKPVVNGQAGQEDKIVSLIICTRDRPQQLRCCLVSVATLIDAPDEIVVVDNGRSLPIPDDMTTEYGAQLVKEPLPGLCRARNRGLSIARGNIVAFIDDDVILDKHWLAALKRAYAHPEIQAVLGLVLPQSQETAAQRLFEQEFNGLGRGHERKIFQGEADIPNVPQMGVGANMSFRRQALLDFGGFNEALDPGVPTQAGGDMDAFYRLLRCGGVIVYEPTMIVRHEHRREMQQLKSLLRAYGSGTAAAYASWSLSGDWQAARMWLALYLRYFPRQWREARATQNSVSTALVWEAFKGALIGPFLYLQSRWQVRRYPKILKPVQDNHSLPSAVCSEKETTVGS